MNILTYSGSDVNMPQAKSYKFVASLIEFSVLITLARKEMKDEMRDDTSRDKEST